jgi:molecular chaperone DnaK (HSP70)
MIVLISYVTDTDHVLLVGASSQISAVKMLLSRLFAGSSKIFLDIGSLHAVAKAATWMDQDIA